MYSGSGSGDTPDDSSSGGSDDPGGNQESGNEDAPEVICVPPSSLKKPITLTLPPYETSLDVAWSGTNGWHSTIQKTTLTVSVVTITTVDIWLITVRDKRTDSTIIWPTFPVTLSIKLPTFTSTNRLPETTKDAVARSPGTRIVTPPPYPWTYTPPDPPKAKLTSDTPGGDDDDDDDSVPSFPINPTPPTRPVPKPTGGPEPTGKPVKPKDPPKVGTKPENKEHETDEQQCALELGLPLPTWRDPDATTSVKSKPTPPKPSPTPDPEQPSPNPDTEDLDCYNSGQFINRGLAIEALEYFCDRFEGQVLDATRPETERTLMCKHGAHCIPSSVCIVDVIMSVTVKNGCRFTMGGKGVKSECGRVLRRMIDECDTSSATREHTLNSVAKATRQRAARPNTSVIRELVLENLQNRPLPENLTDGLLENIARLHIRIAFEMHGTPEDEVQLSEIREYEPYLQSTLIPSVAEQLVELTISAQTRWGAIIGEFDGKGLYFLRLKTLTLAEYVIVCHDQFDW
ncbi:hypothetical protein QQZ08_002777 [Neonectria magnoliae]|uniref:Uncharacterized protein n=1 Tax=Neonectria magnoliae TaxID=2732573 RepID=A0ABR1IAU4_9HYPO